MKIKIGSNYIGERGKCFVIAEAGCNHNGKLKLAMELIESAKECGCNAIKFQAFKTENLVSRNAAKARYQKGRSCGSSQFEMLKSLELSIKEHRRIIEYAKKIGIPLFYSVFDVDSADLVERLGVDIFKLGSGELTNIPFINYLAKKGRLLILSTGMATDSEIQEAVDTFRGTGNKKLILMHCSTGYPSRIKNANLRRAGYLAQRFSTVCGNSDHTTGIIVSALAAALGMPIIEKHFTLSKKLPGPDQRMSMDRLGMKKLCSIVRLLEKKPVREDGLQDTLKKAGINLSKFGIRQILGAADRRLLESEKRQRVWARKSIIAIRDIKKGAVITSSDLAIKRPEEGIMPKYYDKVLGARARIFIKKETPINWGMLQ